MQSHVNVLREIPENALMSEVKSFKELDEADIVTAYRDANGTYTVESTVFVIDGPAGLAATSIAVVGKMSVFGGPDDQTVRPDEGLALYSPESAADIAELLLPEQPAGTTGLVRRLDPETNYIACRWDYPATPKHYLRGIKVRVTNPMTGRYAEARPVDWGPNAKTGRVADLSPGLAKKLRLETDDECRVDIVPPRTGVAAGVDIAAIDKVIFLPDMSRALVAMTTLNNATYWVTDQIGTIEGGQTLMRCVSSSPPEVILSDTTVLPVLAGDLVPPVVAEQLNKAVRSERAIKKAKADPSPGPEDDINAKLFAKAKTFVGYDTGSVPGTDHGNLACAWAVNEVVRLTLGKPISYTGKGNGLGTRELYDALRGSHRRVNFPRPGSIIISPTPPSGSVHGHVGIVGDTMGDFDATQIFSNSSSEHRFAQNRTIKTWKARYEAKLHLEVLFFDVDPNGLK